MEISETYSRNQKENGEAMTDYCFQCEQLTEFEDQRCTNCGYSDKSAEEFQKTNPLARGDKNIKPLEVYAEHAEIRKQVHDEIKKLHWTLGASNSYTVYKFLDCITPLKNLYDPGRLPVYATVPRSTVSDKRSCVWAIVSCLVQAYWEYELDDSIAEDKVLVLVNLNALKEVNEHYPEMKIAGAEDKGYWLEL